MKYFLQKSSSRCKLDFCEAIFIENSHEQRFRWIDPSNFYKKSLVGMDLLKPTVPFYTIQLPNADTIITILPFFLFGILLLTAIFASFISYQQLLFVPDDSSQISYSDAWIGAIPFGLLFVIFLGTYLTTLGPTMKQFVVNAGQSILKKASLKK
jgi:hypothetical protein